MIKNYKNISPDTFVKLYAKNKEIYAGLQSMNPLKMLPYEYNETKKYFETVRGKVKYILIVME